MTLPSHETNAALLRIRDLLRQRTAAAAAEAVRTAVAAIAQDPGHAILRLATADAFRATGDRERAILETKAAIGLGVNMPEASFNVGVLLAEAGASEEALAWFDRAIRERPSYAAALNNFGELHHAAGRLDDAERAFVAAISAAPDNRVARFNLGNVYRDQGRLADAEREFSAVLTRDPNSRPTWAALAAVQRADGRLDDAARSLTGAIRVDPTGSNAEFTTLGSVLAERGDIAAARDAYVRARRLEPHNVQAALGELLTLPQIYESVEHLAAERRRFSSGLARLAAELPRAPGGLSPERALAHARWSNFYLAYHGEDDRELQARYADWLAFYVDSIDPALRAPVAPSPSRARIRIGFASRFLTHSTIGMYFGSWVRDLDRRRFEVFLYDFQGSTDEVSKALAASADRYRALRTRGRPLAQVAAAIRDDALDVLVYPELGMDDTTFALASMRLAPVQCCAWGHPVTSGHPTIDFYLTPAAMEPEGSAAHYREKLVGLPGIGTAYPRPPQVAPAGREELGLPADLTLLACPQSLFKIHPETDALIARVAAAAPDSRVVLFAGRHPLITDLFMRRLGAEFARQGMNARERCLVLPTVSREDYLRFTSACDLVLDTLHWSGGNTSLDALSCGLPLVTLPGRFMRGRQSMAMLQALELPELVAESSDDYVRRAGELARDAQARAGLAARIRERSPRLYDDPSPLRALEDFLERTVRERPD